MVTHPLWRPFAPSANAERQSQRVAHRQTEPGPVTAHDPGWPADFARVDGVIRAAIGTQVLSLRHIGSTAVPGLPSKPVIDVDLTVPDVGQERAYLPLLEHSGFRLVFRDDLGGEPHRQLTFAQPNTNLHVWNPGATEPLRHTLFTEWLRSHPEDRALYSGAKEAATAPGQGARYNDLKAACVYDIYERAFAADPRHRHDPQPRTRWPA